MRIALGLDMDLYSGDTFKLNFPKAKFLLKDICEVPAKTLKKDLPARPWLFSGCAPCQPFSRQNGARSARDSRRGLLDQFSRFIVEWHPEYVFVENVPGLQNIGSGGPLGRFIRVLRSNDYAVSFSVLPALWYGVPQRRDRLVLIASESGAVGLPPATHGTGLRPFSTVREWIENLPELKAGETDRKDPVHRASALSEENMKRILATPEGKGRESWPDNLILDCHRRHGGHTDVYGRLAWDKPASGLTTRCIRLSNGRFGHPEQARALSAREAACLQTFPKSYQFSGNLTSIATQIGNAVPPLMARRIGETILAHHKRCKE